MLLPQSKRGRQQLSNVADFGRTIVELGGGEKQGASEALPKQSFRGLPEPSD
jgi:hypothetical protein